MKLSDEELTYLDEHNDEADNTDGPCCVGTVIYSKSGKLFMVIVGHSMFMDAIEIDPPHQAHIGISGYCYNMNIIRIPNDKLTEKDKQEVVEIVETLGLKIGGKL